LKSATRANLPEFQVYAKQPVIPAQAGIQPEKLSCAAGQNRFVRFAGLSNCWIPACAGMTQCFYSQSHTV
jgi:hypothetical protein